MPFDNPRELPFRDLEFLWMLAVAFAIGGALVQGQYRDAVALLDRGIEQAKRSITASLCL